MDFGSAFDSAFDSRPLFPRGTNSEEAHLTDIGHAYDTEIVFCKNTIHVHKNKAI